MLNIIYPVEEGKKNPVLHYELMVILYRYSNLTTFLNVNTGFQKYLLKIFTFFQNLDKPSLYHKKKSY